MTSGPIERRSAPPPRADASLAERSWIVVPAFREAGSIGDVVAALVEQGWRVVVVDDGSDDATAVVARDAGAWVLRHPVNLGQGAALRTGFAFALQRPETAYVVTFDADGQHDMGAIGRLLVPVVDGSADVALGSRFLTASGAPVGIPPLRRAMLHAATWLARRTTGLVLTDTHNGMRAFSRRALELMVLEQDRMAHASEMLAQIAGLQLRYREVPVRVTYTAYSLAKGQRMLDAISVLWDLLIAKAR